MGGLRQAEIEVLCQLGKKLVVKKGHCLSAKDEGRYLYYLKEGICALVRYTKDGEEVIYHYFQEGELLGGVPLYLMNGEMPGKQEREELSQFYTKSNCVLYKIRYEDFQKYAAVNGEVYFSLSQAISYNFHRVINHFHSQREDLTPVRIYKLLLELGERKGSEYVLNKYFNYVELAKYLGVHTVTVSKIMLDLKHKGIVEKRGHSIIIVNPEALMEIIEKATA